MIKNTSYYSNLIGKLPKGCQLCVKGSKLVLFITGICCRKCYYCPISDQKHNKDVVYADEWPVKNFKEIIEEAKLIDAEGAGITGGDPLCRLERTIKYIKSLKKIFGKGFHIHLYTSFDLIDEKKTRRLYESGLDEIRFHPDLNNQKLWNKIELVNQFKWDKGIEIPVFPETFVKTKKLIDYFYDKVDFINLNELEFADNSFNRLPKNFKTKDKISYAIKGSEEMALKLLNYIENKYPKLNVHYCSAKLKDKVQMANRIKRRAKNVAKDYDVIDKEGLLIRGVIYCKNLEKVKKELMKEFKIPSNLIEIDIKRKRILTGAWIIDELKKELKNKRLKIAIVKEYPTYDCLNIITDFL
jgi:uncharacterized protein